MFNQIEAVIFDMDGTLIDSMWLWKQIDIEYLARFDQELPDDLQKDIEGMSFSETANYFKTRFNIKDNIEVIKNDWNTMAADFYKHRVTIKDDAKLFIDELKKRNIKVGIGTSNSPELVSVIMKKFSMEDTFDSIRTSCQVDKGKPHPDIFLKVASDLGVDPEKCMVFEDVPNGLVAANRAGMISVAIHDDFSKDMEAEKRELADFYINTYKEVVDVIVKGNK